MWMTPLAARRRRVSHWPSTEARPTSPSSLIGKRLSSPVMTDTALAFDIFDPAFKADPYPTYRRLRAERPVVLDEHAPLCWLFRHADCEEALRDPRLGSPLGSPEVLARKLGD